MIDESLNYFKLRLTEMDHTRKPSPVIVGIGEILWDILPGGKRLGGAPANFALHAHLLGAQAKILSAVGQDNSAQDISEQLNKKAIGTNDLQVNTYPTGWVDVQIDSTGQPEYIIHENVAWDYIEFSSQSRHLAGICDAVCFGTLAQRNIISRQSIQQFLAHTRNDCLRVFDINLRQNYFSRDIIIRSLQAANILKLNDQELEVLQNLLELPRSMESALKALLERYELDLVALTQGPAGSTMMDPKSICHCPGTPVVIKDTVGAGDSFTATMIMGKLFGVPIDKINQLASKVAAYVCSQAGATPVLPADLISELKKEMSAADCENDCIAPSVKTK